MKQVRKQKRNEAMSETKCVETSPVERLVILPPYVEPEHRQLIEKAEDMLAEYEERLLERIKSKIFDHSPSIQTHPSDIREAEIEFHSDPTRQLLLKQLMNIKLLCERPRFVVKAI